ncbi:hypothetical protein [Wenzhouxiangella sediminis]|nr:hypothetical protein [Wenzhouxiangella sediminis]
MKPVLSLTLHCILAVALLTGSVSAWATGAAHGGESEIASSGQVEADSGHCHVPRKTAERAPDCGDDDQGCCADQADCPYESCDCSCSALTLVVPTRISTSQYLPTRIASSNLPPGSLRNAIDTPLRPPQA